MNLTKKHFATQIRESNSSIASLEEWKEFDWNEDAGPYVIGNCCLHRE